MTNSVTSTERRASPDGAGFHTWHFFLLLSMAGATVAVIVSPETHPAALLLLSAAVICAGLVAVALAGAISGFLTRRPEEPALPVHAREQLLKEKALVLRSIKELEFDHAMGKVSDADFASIQARLRARALALMDELDRVPAAPAVNLHGRSGEPAPVPPADRRACASCGTNNEGDARFCKQCGAALETATREDRR